MAQIQAANLTFAYEGSPDNIFENVSFFSPYCIVLASLWTQIGSWVSLAETERERLPFFSYWQENMIIPAR